jgi:hypothetical protein
VPTGENFAFMRILGDICKNPGTAFVTESSFQYKIAKMEKQKMEKQNAPSVRTGLEGDVFRRSD